MGFGKRFKKALKRVQKRGIPVVRKVARVASYGAPILGGLVGGPLGAATGTVIGAGASQIGTGDKKKRLKAALIAGVGTIGATGALSALSGASLTGSGLTQSPLSSLSNIFGGGRGPSTGPAPTSEEAPVPIAGPNALARILNPGYVPRPGDPDFMGPVQPGAESPGIIDSILAGVGGIFGGGAASNGSGPVNETGGGPNSPDGGGGEGGGDAGAGIVGAFIGAEGPTTLGWVVLVFVGYRVWKSAG